MDPLTLGLIFGGATAAKNELFDVPAERKKALEQAEITRYSPWTGMHGQDANYENSIGKALAGGMGGAQLGMDLSKYNAQKDYLSALTAQAKEGNIGSPYLTPAQTYGVNSDLTRAFRANNAF